MTTAEVPRDFLVVLAETNNGRSVPELSAALCEVVAAVTATGKPGKLRYDMVISPPDNVHGAVLVTDSITPTIPKLPRPSSLFFVDGKNLTQHDPRQQSLFSGNEVHHRGQ